MSKKVDVKKFDFRPAPFWFLNHELTDEEIIFQLDKFKEAHVSGAFMHPRAGNYPQTYSSKEWFEKIDFICSEAEKRGLKMWLYDEDPFPSGVAGGRVFLDNPEFRAHRMYCFKATPDENGKVDLKLGRNVVLGVYAIKKENGKSHRIDITESVGTVRGPYFHRSTWPSPYYWDMMGKQEFMHMRAEISFSEMAVITTVPEGYEVYAMVAIPVYNSKYGGMADIINPKAVDKFIEYTHAKYKEYSGRYFGSVIPGIFTDEPQVCGGFPHAFSFIVFDEFKKEYGYDIRPHLVDVIEEIDDDSKKYRRDYRKLMVKLLEKNFYKKLYDWCDKNNIYMTGHLAGEESLNTQVLGGQNFYTTLLKYSHIPGVDFLGHNLGDNDHFALTVGGKLVSSVANQSGKPAILCEFAACNPFNYDIKGLERIAFYQLVLGINLLVPHAYHFSLEGFRKFDAGCSFFYQFKDFDKMADFNEMIGKFSKLCAEGKDLSDVLVIMPYDYTYGAEGKDPKIVEHRTRIVEACKKLTNRYIEYNVMDDITIEDCPIVDGKVKMMKMEYSTVIVFNDATDKKVIDRLVDGGVNVVDENQIETYDFNGVNKTDIQAINGDCLRIMVLKKKAGAKIRYYIYNSGFGQVEFNVDVKTPSAKIIEPYKKDRRVKTENGIVHIVMDGCDALIIEECNRTDVKRVNKPKKYTGKLKSYKWMTNPELDYVIYDRENQVIEDYDVEISSINENLAEKYKKVKYGLVREKFGTTYEYQKTLPMPTFDFRDIKAFKIYPVKAKYTTKFKNKKNLKKLLIESTTFVGDCKITLNGIELKLSDFNTERVYDYRNKTLDVSNILTDGENVLTVEYQTANEFDGITSRIYLI